jgi:hypothetical protein
MEKTRLKNRLFAFANILSIYSQKKEKITGEFGPMFFLFSSKNHLIILRYMKKIGVHNKSEPIKINFPLSTHQKKQMLNMSASKKIIGL